MLRNTTKVFAKRLNLVCRYLRRNAPPDIVDGHPVFADNQSMRREAQAVADELHMVAESLLPKTDAGRATEYYASRWWPWRNKSEAARTVDSFMKKDSKDFMAATFEPHLHDEIFGEVALDKLTARGRSAFKTWLASLGPTGSTREVRKRKASLSGNSLEWHTQSESIGLYWTEPRRKFKVAELFALHLGRQCVDADASSQYVRIPATSASWSLVEMLVEQHPEAVRHWLAVLVQAYQSDHRRPFRWSWLNHRYLLQGAHRHGDRLSDPQKKRGRVFGLLRNPTAYFGKLSRKGTPFLIEEALDPAMGSGAHGLYRLDNDMYKRTVPFDANWLRTVDDSGSAFRKIGLLVSLLKAWRAAPPSGGVEMSAYELLAAAGYRGLAQLSASRRRLRIKRLLESILPDLKSATGLQFRRVPGDPEPNENPRYIIEPSDSWALRCFWDPPEQLFVEPVGRLPAMGRELRAWRRRIRFTSRRKFASVMADVANQNGYAFSERIAGYLESKDRPLPYRLRRDLPTVEALLKQKRRR